MSSKKILAASLAAMLAVGSVGAMAFADDVAASAWPANDEFNWTISGKDAGKDGTYTIKLSTTENLGVSAGLYQVYGADNFAMKVVGVGLWQTLKDFDIQSLSNASVTANVKGKANYENNPRVTATENAAEYVMNGAYGTTPAVKNKDGDFIYPTFDVVRTATTAGTITLKWQKQVEGQYVDYALDDDELAGFKAALKKVDGTAASRVTGEVLFTAPLIKDAAGNDTTNPRALEENDIIAAVKKVNEALWAVKNSNVCDGTNGGLATKEVTGKGSVNLNTTLTDTNKTPDATGPWSGTTGKATAPANLNVAINLGTGEKLAKAEDIAGGWMDLSEVNFEVKAEMVVSEATYNKYIDKKYSINGNGGYTWTGGTAHWDTNSNKFVWDTTTDAGLALLVDQYSDYGGWHYSDNSNYIKAIAVRDNLTEEPKYDEKFKDLFIAKTGDTGINFAQIVPPNVMKNLNNGGTITFYFDKAMDWSAYETGWLQFWNSNNKITLNAQSGYSISDDKITFELPAGMSYDEALNAYKPFNLKWHFENNLQADEDNNIWANSNEKPAIADYDGKIIAISFHANGAAVSDDNNSNNSGSNSGSNGGNTTNPGSTGNPNTGIALAVAPVVLAAGAVATVVAKKRK